MHKLKFLLALLLIALTTFAQTEVEPTWKKFYSFSDSTTLLYDVIATSDNSYLLVGSAISEEAKGYVPIRRFEVLAVKVDLEGNVIWHNSFSNYLEFYGELYHGDWKGRVVAELANGGFAIGIDRTTMLSGIAANGDSLWNMQSPNNTSFKYVNDMFVHSNGDIYALYGKDKYSDWINVEDNGFTIFRVNPQGEQVAIKEYYDREVAGRSFVERPDGSIVVAGDKYVRCYDPETLSLLWEHTTYVAVGGTGGFHDNRFRSVVSTSDGGLLLTGLSTEYNSFNTYGSWKRQIRVERLDADRNILWTKSYGEKGKTHCGGMATELKGGEFAVINTRSSTSSLLVLSSEGDSLMYKPFDKIYNIVAAPNGGVTVLGRINSDSKFPGLFYFAPETWGGVTDTTSVVVPEDNNSKTTKTQIALNHNGKELFFSLPQQYKNGQAKLYTLLGREVATVPLQKGSISTSTLSKGTYILSVVGEGFSFSNYFVKK